MKRKELRMNRSRNEECSFEVVSEIDLDHELPEEQEEREEPTEDSEWQPESNTKKKRRFVETWEDADDDMPYKYKYIFVRDQGV